MEFVEVDGSRGEGGGQILRTALAFSAIRKKPVRVTNIRAGRSEPGLKRQHVSAIAVLAEVFGGTVEGSKPGSSTVSFVPGDSDVASMSLDMGTAASITLVLQAVVPAVALSRRTLRLELSGGTDVPWSPTFDYFGLVVREAFRRIGVSFEANAGRRGYYPRGGGQVLATIGPCESVLPLEMTEAGDRGGVRILSRCGSLPRHVAERQLSSAQGAVERAGLVVAEGKATESESDSPGSSLLIHSESRGALLGSDGIGARGKPAEQVGSEVAARYMQEIRSGSCLDENLADMVIPLLSLATSKSSVRLRRVTPHLESGLEIAKLFTSCTWRAVQDGTGIIIHLTPGTR